VPMIALSMLIWLTFFYLGPFWLFYALLRLEFLAKRHVVLQALGFVGLMFIGANMVSRVHQQVFPSYTFGLHEQFLSAFLWGVFIYAMAQTYLLYMRFTEERRLRQQAQLADLTSRLNPHFLFNSLNTISALIHTAPDSADDLLHKLAGILRYSVDEQSEWIPLERELEVCKTYLSIEKARFTENLQVNWQLDQAIQLERYKVPPLLLQPLIENATKHVKTRPVILTISISQQTDKLVFEIKDNGAGFPTELLTDLAKAGAGLTIVKQRVALIGGQFAIRNQAGSQGGAVCTIKLPNQPSA